MATAIAIGVLGVVGWALLSLPFKWQAWASRFDLPLFGLLCVPFGIAMSRTTKRASALVMASWMLGALPALGLASHRPLIGADFIARIPGVRPAVTTFGGERMRRAFDTEVPTAPSVLGATDEKLFHVSLDPQTLACDKEKGIRVRPEHIHHALREHAGIAEHPLAKKFPLEIPEKEKLRGLWG